MECGELAGGQGALEPDVPVDGDEPGFGEPGLDEPGLDEPGLDESGLDEPGFGEPEPGVPGFVVDPLEAPGSPGMVPQGEPLGDVPGV